MKNGADPRCRICTEYEKTIDHLISGCPTLDQNEYLNRPGIWKGEGWESQQIYRF